ncbi:MAG: carbon starvation protein A [Elusimicrobia bacterium]|nr:carbon starvation protein A [Elusimicrobiota bacterium]
MNAAPFLVVALCVMALGYRYYSAFIAAKLLVLDDSRVTPAHRLEDGSNYHPTNKWVLFGHHFAAISGAGPLIGPVLAAQFGFLPGFLWLLGGVVLAGAVHDFMILGLSIRHDGRSLAEIARREVSPLAGMVASAAILLIIVIALAGLGIAVVNALHDSAWGTFTIGATIPIALFVGLYMYRLRPGKIAEASVLGVLAVLVAVVAGAKVQASSWAPLFTLTKGQITGSMAVYGFVASVLPVWLLLCPRDYLSSYMKIGTIFALVAGTVIVMPAIKMPMLTPFMDGGGPIIPGKAFPFVFITIACGAISGFHGLVASGTTPKMIGRESDARAIGYGAMLLEGLVGIVALIAASALEPGDYFAINVPVERFAALGMPAVHLPELSAAVGEELAGRTGGAVSLAVGFAGIFSALPGLKGWTAYWYHYAIMFEALFILTTIDTGTRVGRFLLQEFLGRFWAPFKRPDWVPGSVLATGLLVGAWSYLIVTGSIATIWPMFGVANQLLAAVSLSVATTALINAGKARYAWVTGLPFVFVTVTTLAGGWLNITRTFLPLARAPETRLQGVVDLTLTVLIMACAVLILGEAARRIARVRAGKAEPAPDDAPFALGKPGMPTGCC